jgi:hypothetical protein
MMTAFFSMVYALSSMLLGSMLILTPLGPPYYAEIVWSGSAPSWNYPGLLIVQPWGVVTLPFFETVAMILVSIGVGIGMSIAVLLAISLVRNRRRRAAQPTAVGTVAGLTPAMIALVTLGACCSTTAAATAGVGLVGQVSGTSTDNLLLNNWFLGVFQIAVVWIALLAQEMILRVYGTLFDRGLAADESFPASVIPPRLDRYSLASGAARVALLAGGVTWALSVLAAWTVTNPATAPGGAWFAWLVQRELVALLAVVVALFPRSVLRSVGWVVGNPAIRVARAALFAAGLSLLIGTPPPLSTEAAAGLGNQIAFAVAGPHALWAVAPPAGGVVALLFACLFQYGLLGAFALCFATHPRATVAWLARSGGIVGDAAVGQPALRPDATSDRVAPTSSPSGTDS